MGTDAFSDRTAGPPPYLKDRYRLVEQLGRGSMAIVYRARDETLDRDVAIKFLRPERLAGGEASARFLREARAVARLSHPNIMTLYDVDREGDWHYLVLEHIPGQDLHASMVAHGGSLHVAEALRVARGVLEALAYAHELNIVHRDVKPENIMLTPAGQVKVADFGLALAQEEGHLTQEGMIVGTAFYLAPELITGAPAGPRTDLYAVGAVLYESLTGRPPFTGDDLHAIFAQILNTPVTPPRALVPSLPPEVEHVVVTLLAKNPSERYASAREALESLPAPAADRDFATPAAAGQASADRASLSWLERMVRSPSTTHAALPAVAPPAIGTGEKPPAALPESAEAAPPPVAPELLFYAAREDTAAAVEAERRRLARSLQGSVIEPLNLLLSQANAYEQTLGANPTARMAVSVLTSLARQVLQQVRDLGDNLQPAVLEALGLEPALETLSTQAMRSHGLQTTLAVERMRERLPSHLELALFRAAQDALDRAVRHAHASHVTIRLARRDERLTFAVSDNGLAAAGSETLRPACERLEQLGARVTMSRGPQGGFELSVSVAMEAPVQLTPREMETLKLLVEGLSNKEIARALSISPRTVNFHLDNLYSKLGVSSRTEAAIYALRQGWIRQPPAEPRQINR